MFMFLCLCVLWTLAVADNVTVTLPYGQLLGKQETTRANYQFYSFSGVRYGQAPVGNLRFQPPVLFNQWLGVYDATYEKNICYQVTGNANTENEDCLFLNIYTPKISDTLLPVMFFIHGGGFIQGLSGRNGKYGPDFFMEFDVVLVTINYRLGPFGFASTGDDVIPGNNGLKDQTLALKWVQDNIKYFGGDPTKVTIFGQSAGSASVAYHLLSPKSTGLFRAAILESGSAMSPWAYQRDQRYYTFKTAELINADSVKSNSSQDVLNFLLNVTAKQIDTASAAVNSEQTVGNLELQQGFYYAPVIEPEHEDAFLTSYMYSIFESGSYNKVPVIIGMNGEEMLGQYSSSFKNTVDAFGNSPNLLLPKNMHLTEGSASANAVVQSIQTTYTISKDVDYHDQIVGTVRYLSDTCFTRSIIKQAQLQSNYNDVYFYVFSYDGVMGDYAGKLAGTGNVEHSEELNYLFTRNLKTTNLDNSDLSQFPETDVNVHKRLMKLWTNFAIDLNPTPTSDDLLQQVTWPKVDASSETLQYLDINENLSIQENPRNTEYTVWDNLYQTYAIKPLDGY